MKRGTSRTRHIPSGNCELPSRNCGTLLASRELAIGNRELSNRNSRLASRVHHFLFSIWLKKVALSEIATRISQFRFGNSRFLFGNSQFLLANSRFLIGNSRFLDSWTRIQGAICVGAAAVLVRAFGFTLIAKLARFVKLAAPQEVQYRGRMAAFYRCHNKLARSFA